MENNQITPTISIVLGSYNRYRFLKETIKSIRKNGIKVPYEIIVIDGGSTDASINWLVKQSDILTIVQHNRVLRDGKLIMKHTWGYFMNIGFKSAKGKYILMISDDCLLIPCAVMNGYNLFERELEKGRNVGAVAFYWRNFPDQKNYNVGLTLGNKMFVNHGLYLRNALKEVDWIDEDYYRFYHADGDLCLRMWEAGYETIDSPESYVEHCTHISKKVRHSNPGKEDWKRYLNRWNGIYYSMEKQNIGGWITKEFFDPDYTYRTILKTSLRIAIQYYGHIIYNRSDKIMKKIQRH